MEQKKIRIAIETSYMDRRSAKGTAIVIRNTVKAMRAYRDQFDITLVHRESIPEDPLYKEFNEIIIPRVSLPKFSNFFSELFFFLTTKEQFDIYYFSYSRLYPTFWLAPAKRIVYAAMDGGPQTAGYFDKRTRGKESRWTRLFKRHISAFIAISEFGKQGIISTYHLTKPGNVHVVYNGVDSIFEPASRPRADIHTYLQKQYGLPANYILNVSRFDPHKNIIRTIEAYKQLVDEGIAETLVFVGGRHHPDYSKEVDDCIARLGLGERVIIAPYIADTDMPLVYQGAKMFVFTTLYEGFGLPVIEAMKCRIPCVLSDIAVLREISAGNAEFFDPYDVAAIAHAIRQGYHVPDERIDNAYRQAASFTWQAHGEAIANVFRCSVK